MYITGLSIEHTNRLKKNIGLSISHSYSYLVFRVADSRNWHAL